MTDQAWETLSNQLVAVSGVLYFLALIAHLVEWSSLRRLPADEEVTTGRTAMFGRLGLILTGLGPVADPTAVRRAAGVAARAATNATSVAVALPADSPELVRAVTEGLALGSYTFTTYKRDTAGKNDTAGTVTSRR